ncbi:hypothetical protein BGY98DRAFT_938318 [Russula aff. rugulosa BPL654]|nr:hypothetical protein BGY98DRAFT_938318 [Russula aff. rugulosa BPL654]
MRKEHRCDQENVDNTVPPRILTLGVTDLNALKNDVRVSIATGKTRVYTGHGVNPTVLTALHEVAAVHLGHSEGRVFGNTADERRGVLCDLRAPSIRIGVVERDVEIVVSVGLSVLPPPTQGSRARPATASVPVRAKKDEFALIRRLKMWAVDEHIEMGGFFGKRRNEGETIGTRQT